ncbi:hypothetical protein ABPG77_005101 [Micractinium sp. CCAP 211/92]
MADMEIRDVEQAMPAQDEQVEGTSPKSSPSADEAQVDEAATALSPREGSAPSGPCNAGNGAHSHSQEEQQQEEQEAQEADGGGEKADLPFDAPFAPLRSPFDFWQDGVLLCLLGGALGAFGYAYLTAFTKVTSAWLRADGNGSYPDAASLQFGAGRAWWAGLTAGAGLVVGLAKAILNLDEVPTFIAELRSMHVEPLKGAATSAVALLGFLGGVPMGPEAGLGAAAGAAGALLGRLPGLRPAAGPAAATRSRLYIFSAMCSALAAIIPTPLATLLLVLELGRPTATRAPLSEVPVMRTLTLLGAGATASFAVYYAIQGGVYLAPFNTLLSVVPYAKYNQVFIVEGMFFGVIGAAFGFCYILIGGVVKALVGALRRTLDARFGHRVRMVVLATAGGLATGLLGWAMPLVLTDGSEQLDTVLRQSRQVDSSVLAASAFAKALAYHLCAECGFHGGLFLPMLSMSAMLGAVFMNETGVNKVVAMACSLIAMPAAVIPAPIMLSVLAVSLLQGGTEGLVPIFTTALTAHLLCLGLGFPQWLVSAAAARKRQKAR